MRYMIDHITIIKKGTNKCFVHLTKSFQGVDIEKYVYVYQ